jgi:diguanylate cyclase (GGDEF)-like protein
MTQSFSFKTKLSPFLFLAVVYVLANLYYPSMISRKFTLKFYDLILALDAQFLQKSAEKEDFSVAVVSIDRPSLEYVNQRWPWDRSVIAGFLERVASAHPRIVGLDLMFSGVSNPESDTALGKALSAYPRIVIGSLFDAQGNYVKPFPQFIRENVSVGAINVPQDEDGVIRGFSLAFEDPETKSWVPSFSTALAAAYWGLGDEVTASPRENRGGYSKFPVLISAPDAPKKLYASTPSLTRPLAVDREIERVSFVNVMKEEETLRKLEGKIVLVGVEERILGDYHMTPAGIKSGIFMHVLAVKSLLAGREIFYTHTLVSLLLFFFLTISAFVCRFFLRRWITALLSVFLMTGLFLGSLFLFHYQSILVDLSFPLMGSLLAIVLFVIYQDAEEQMKMQSLKRKADMDSLTGVYNVASFQFAVEQAMGRQRRASDSLALIIFDIDKFKQINDTYGHDKGNQVILAFVSTLKKGVRSRDLIGRFGGDEFCVLIGVRDAEEARKFMERITSYIREFSQDHPDVPAFHISAGVAVLRGGNMDYKSFLKKADQALYQAKEKGRNRFEVVEV